MPVDLGGKSWRLFVTRNLNFFQACMDAAGHFRYSERYGAASIEELHIVKDGRHDSIFYNDAGVKRGADRVEKICSNPKKLARLVKAYRTFGLALLRASDRLENNPTAAAYDEFVLADEHLCAGLSLTTLIGRRMPEVLSARLQKAFPEKPKNELDALIGEITYPEEHTPLVESQLSLLAIGAALQKKKAKARDIRNHPSVYRRFLAHAKKYAAIPVGFNEDPWTEAEIEGQLADVMRKDCAEEIRALTKRHADKVKRAKQLLAKTDRQTSIIARSVQVGTLMNEYRKFVFCRASLAYRPLFGQIAEKYGLGHWREVWKLTPEEVPRLWFKGDRTLLKAIKKRKVAGVMSSATGPGYRVMTAKEISDFLPETLYKKPEGGKAGGAEAVEVRGMVGNPGFVKAPCRIILSKSDFHKFKDGDVLIAPMTSVDYVPLMKRASAFVTNEGGVTSHASIVSRELGKPCVIGTKNATHTFSDGDVLEVDANKGIVRKIR